MTEQNSSVLTLIFLLIDPHPSPFLSLCSFISPMFFFFSFIFVIKINFLFCPHSTLPMDYWYLYYTIKSKYFRKSRKFIRKQDKEAKVFMQRKSFWNIFLPTFSCAYFYFSTNRGVYYIHRSMANYFKLIHMNISPVKYLFNCNFEWLISMEVLSFICPTTYY